jgi:hypothetical protein
LGRAGIEGRGAGGGAESTQSGAGVLSELWCEMLGEVMTCPHCDENCGSSKVTAEIGEGTTMGWFPFYDEQGLYHSHDPNKYIIHYSCTNQHYWTEQKKLSCPNCSYPSEVTE